MHRLNLTSLLILFLSIHLSLFGCSSADKGGDPKPEATSKKERRKMKMQVDDVENFKVDTEGESGDLGVDGIDETVVDSNDYEKLCQGYKKKEGKSVAKPSKSKVPRTAKVRMDDGKTKVIPIRVYVLKKDIEYTTELNLKPFFKNAKYKKIVYSCYSKALELVTDILGKSRIEINLSKRGRVINTKVLKNSKGLAPVSKCIAERLVDQIITRPFKDPDAQMILPILFCRDLGSE